MYKKLTILFTLLMPAMVFGTGSNSVLGKRPAETVLHGQPPLKQSYFMIGNEKFFINHRQPVAQATSVAVVDHYSRENGFQNELEEQPKYHFTNTEQGILGLSIDPSRPPIILEQSFGRDSTQIFINTNGNIESFSNDMEWNLSGRLLRGPNEIMQESSLIGEIASNIDAVVSDDNTFVTTDSECIFVINQDNQHMVMLENSFGLQSNRIFLNDNGFFQYGTSERIWDSNGREIVSGQSNSQELENLFDLAQEVFEEEAAVNQDQYRIKRVRPADEKKTEFVCACGFTYKPHQYQWFVKHLIDYHKEEKPYVCHYVCRKNYASKLKGDLKKHETRHSGLQFCCPASACNVSLFRKDLLENKHIKGKHPHLYAELKRTQDSVISHEIVDEQPASYQENNNYGAQELDTDIFLNFAATN